MMFLCDVSRCSRLPRLPVCRKVFFTKLFDKWVNTGARHFPPSGLVSYLQSFAQGRFHLAILIGPAGLAKSRTARRVLGADV